ncbi:MAG: N-acetyl-gamma-glutamyl-phosphate reductase [Bacteroides sp.]|nr:N-acetyl-gamma-glutamyl-phosphate reductase [Bacteroides sp.]
MIKVGILGGTSPLAGELIRLLKNHPDVHLQFVHSTHRAGCCPAECHPDLYGEELPLFTDSLSMDGIDVLFDCEASEETRAILPNLPTEIKIIDCTAFGHGASTVSDSIYGLPELNRRATCRATRVTNPGEVATCVLLGLLPLAKNLMLNDSVAIHLWGDNHDRHTTGCDGEIHHAFAHPQLTEIKDALRQLQNSFAAELNIITYRSLCRHAMQAVITLSTKVSVEEITRMFEEYYERDSFVHLVPTRVAPQAVAHSNKCFVHLEKVGEKLLITSCIDPLLKGGVGQAVHNMNLLFNLEETVGLRLKGNG